MRLVTLLFVPALLAFACTADDNLVPSPSPTPTPEVMATVEPTPSPTAAVLAPETPSTGPQLVTRPQRRSPDRSLLAHVESQFVRCPDGCAVIFEDRQGTEVQRVPFSDPAMSRIADAWGSYLIDVWLDDGSGVVLGGSCDCDNTISRPVVLVMLDGRVIDRGVSALMTGSGRYVSPNGRYLLSRLEVESWASDAVGCRLFGSADVVSLLSGDVVGRVPPSATAITDWQWLDGDNLAYELRPLPDPENGFCSEQFGQWWDLPVEWRLLTIP